jgi:hypothetical protein
MKKNIRKFVGEEKFTYLCTRNHKNNPLEGS